MRTAVIQRPRVLQITETALPQPAAGEVRIRVMASGICGTDVHIYRGEYLGDYPVIPGHEFSGVVDAVGEGVTRFVVGSRVAVEPNIACDNCAQCLNNRQNFCENWQAVGVTRPGGMAQYTIAPEKAVFDVGDLPFEQAAFVEPLSCILHGMIRLALEPAASVLITGAGPIGMLLMQVARLQGASRLTVVERNADRAAAAAALGADQTSAALDDLPQDAFDAVIDATGVPAVMARLTAYARPGGKILLFGVPPSGAELCLDAFSIFRKGLTLLSSYTSVRNSYQAVRLLQTGRVRVTDLISHRLPLEDFQRGLDLMQTGQDGVKKVLILPNGDL